MLMNQEQFVDFAVYLEGKDGCNFRYVRGEVNPVWDCDGTLNKSIAYLKSHGYNLAENLRKIVSLGGHCDCEVLFNVAEKWAAPDHCEKCGLYIGKPEITPEHGKWCEQFTKSVDELTERALQEKQNEQD